MMRHRLLFSMFTVCLLAILATQGFASQWVAKSSSPLEQAIRRAFRSDADETSLETVASLRAFGPSVVSAMQTAMELDPARLAADGMIDKHRARLRLLDAVAAQRDAYASGLFWYTDFAAAQAEAARTGRPILSLRLLGRLDRDLSCANSRFFRTVLYADQRISQTLRDEFVLHWQTVRPVPTITIDMGDGRTIHRTITGNSAHYVLDPQGRVVDVLPGLYGPRVFEKLLNESGELARQLGDMNESTRRETLMAWHAQRGDALDQQLAAWLASDSSSQSDGAITGSSALASTVIAPTKARIETRVIREAVPTNVAAFDAEQWNHIAQRYAEDSRIDDNSQNLMRSKELQTPAAEAGRLAVSKSFVEDPFFRKIRNFENSIALDTARNEHDLHRRVHAWLAAGENLDDYETLNQRVYAELFLMPHDDPWLGLVSPDAYSAIDGSGLTSR